MIRSFEMKNENIQPPTKLYCARWVVPVATQLIEDGAVAVSGTSIVGVGNRAEVEAQFPEAAREDFA